MKKQSMPNERERKREYNRRHRLILKTLKHTARPYPTARPTCKFCGHPVYSRSGEHPQCAVFAAESIITGARLE